MNIFKVTLYSALATGLSISTAMANICTPEEEAIKLTKLSEIHQEFVSKGYHIYGLGSLRNSNYKPYIVGIAKLGRSCATINLYKKIGTTLKSMGYPVEYLDYMLMDAAKNIGVRSYQIGNEWNRKLLSEQEVLTKDIGTLLPSILITGRKEIDTEKRLRLSNPGTAFYLGKVNGQHLVASAAHVFSNDKGETTNEVCQTNLFHFPNGPKMSLKGSHLVGAWPEIDFAICAIKLTNEQKEKLENKIAPIRIDWNLEAKEDVALTTIGYGHHNNPKLGKPLFENSDDCKVVFGDNKAILRDGKLSIGVGCDASPGDSGSPVVERESGNLIGLMWGVQKVKAPYSMTDLEELKKDNKDIVWQELTMVTSLQTIKKTLLRWLKKSPKNQNTKTIELLIK